MAGDVKLLLRAMQLNLAPDKLLGIHDDFNLDTTKNGGVTDIETVMIGSRLDPGQLELVRESRNISESLSDQVTFGVG